MCINIIFLSLLRKPSQNLSTMPLPYTFYAKYCKVLEISPQLWAKFLKYNINNKHNITSSYFNETLCSAKIACHVEFSAEKNQPYLLKSVKRWVIENKIAWRIKLNLLTSVRQF